METNANPVADLREPPLVYSIDEAIKKSGLSRMTLWRKMKSGELQYKHVGRRRLINAASFHEMIGIAS